MSDAEALVKLDFRSARILEEALKIMPYTRAQIVASGVVAKTVERLLELRDRERELSSKYGSMDVSERRIEGSGVPPSDHTLYNELIEWRATKSEMEKLKRFLERL